MNSRSDIETVDTIKTLGVHENFLWHRVTLLLLIISSIYRLCILPSMELAPDEAYYWDWSRNLAPGYYDQGPLIAYLIRITTTIFGTNEFGVRFGIWLVSLGTLICVYVLARRVASALAGFLSVLFLALTPFFTIGSLIATYDPPMVFFWSLTLVFLERAFFAPDLSTQKRAWLFSGAAVGLGLLSKHTMLLALPCLLLFLIVSPARRFWLRRTEPYTAVLLMLLSYSGVILWNYHYHWWTFTHLIFLTQKAETPISRRIVEFVSSQALLLGPGLFVGCLAVFNCLFSGADRLKKTTRLSEANEDNMLNNVDPASSNENNTLRILTAEKFQFFACFGLPIFGFFCLMAFKTKVQGNWAPCAWLTPTILLAVSLANQIEMNSPKRLSAIRKIYFIGTTSGFLTVMMLLAPLRYGLNIRLPVRTDLSNTAYGWRLMADHAEQQRIEMLGSGQRVFIAANDYQTCALLAFYMPDHPRTFDLFLGSRLNMYAAYSDELKLHLGDNAIFVNGGQENDPKLSEVFERVEWNEPLAIWRQPYFSQPIRVLHFARCYNFRRFTGTTGAWGG